MIRYLPIRDKTTPPNILSLSFRSILLEVLNTVDVKISVKSEHSQNLCRPLISDIGSAETSLL